jgi:DNA-binding NtrC family response regulator
MAMTETRHSILIVDDMEDLREALALQLDSDGFAVKTADNGQRALKILASCPCDIVVTDVLMPDMDGIELAQMISRKYPAIDMILISGGSKMYKVDFDYLDMASKLTGVKTILRKPFEYEDLHAAIESLL